MRRFARYGVENWAGRKFNPDLFEIPGNVKPAIRDDVEQLRHAGDQMGVGEMAWPADHCGWPADHCGNGDSEDVHAVGTPGTQEMEQEKELGDGLVMEKKGASRMGGAKEETPRVQKRPLPLQLLQML